MNAQQNEAIEYLARNEEAIARLYQAYADKFPDHQQFWLSLATDENNHAAQIRELLSQTNVRLKPDRFNIVTIQNQIKHVEDEIKKISRPEIKLIYALSFALNLELSLLEQKYFDVFDTDSIELKKVLSGLAEETKRHISIVREMWSKYQKR